VRSYHVNASFENVPVLVDVWVVRWKPFILEHIQNLIITEVVLHPIVAICIETLKDSGIEEGTSAPEVWIFPFLVNIQDIFFTTL
jgi:hypothetical protein